MTSPPAAAAWRRGAVAAAAALCGLGGAALCRRAAGGAPVGAGAAAPPAPGAGRPWVPAAHDGVDVFWPGMASSRCYRIPVVLRSSAGTLLAFAEQRVAGCSDDAHPNLVLRRSLDGGRTWLPENDVITLAAWGGEDQEDLSNINPVEVELPGSGGARRAILVHYDTKNNPTEESHGRNMQVWSYDDGLTWTDRADITEYLPPSFAGCMPGPSVGLSAWGALYFSCHTAGSALVYFSVDRGRSWHASAAIAELNECSLAVRVGAPEEGSRQLLMNCRSMRERRRRQVVWDVAGVGVGEPPVAPQLVEDFYPAGLDDPHCQGSVMALGGALFLSNDNTTRSRSRLTVKRSMDGGYTWDQGLLVTRGPAGYSQLVGWPLGPAGAEHVLGQSAALYALGVLFEAGGPLRFVRWEVSSAVASARAVPSVTV